MEKMVYSVMLDTSCVINLLKKNDQKVIQKIKELSPVEVLISAITKFELDVGISSKESSLEALMSVPCVSLDCQSVSLAAKIFSSLKRKGKTPGFKDCFITALAITNNCTLITSDKGFGEFTEFGLTVQIV